MELCEIALADGIWFTAPGDARTFREHATEFLHRDAIEDTLDRSRVIGSPLTFDRFEESYADQTQWLHVAESLLEKKHADEVLDVAETFFERFGIQTLITSMENVPPNYVDQEWGEAHPNADRECYERALERCDLAVYASEYETLARTWFEQAASGQVLSMRNEDSRSKRTRRPRRRPIDERTVPTDQSPFVCNSRETTSHSPGSISRPPIGSDSG